MRQRFLALGLLLALLLTGCGKGGQEKPAQPEEPVSPAEQPTEEKVTLEALLEHIYDAVPGTAGSSLKAAYAAGMFLDWAMNWADRADQEEETKTKIDAWIKENVPPEETPALVLAWDAVLTQAAAIEQNPETAGELLAEAGYTPVSEYYEQVPVENGIVELSPLFTQLLELAETTPWQEEPGDFASITADRFDGIWANSQDGTLLIFTGGLCRVVYPDVSVYGEIAGTYRVRDRSSMGYCPALEIDYNGEGPINEDGDFWGPLTYYVSGMDSTHFWCNSQMERFDRVDEAA